MDRYTVIALAREADLWKFLEAQVLLPELEHFAALVAAHEREECAKVCEEVGNRDHDTHAWDAAAAIRSRT